METNNEKYINLYRLQYWIYAILNKKFGTEVKIKRDSLHSHYQVNKHCLNITTNTLKNSEVNKFLYNKLLNSNFKILQQNENRTELFKENLYKKNKEELYITISMQDSKIDISLLRYFV